MALLEVHDLEVNYGVIRAIKGINFEVNEGEIVTLIGANGAGKTTTLQSTVGLIPKKSGKVIFNGQDITKIPCHKIVKLGMTQVPEGRRIFGLYRITTDDIAAGRRYDDGICLVTASVDVHKLHQNDTTECQRGIVSQPYHIPYRALVPLGCNNMLLAGRCLSGDFYPFASYRMIGNMGTVGEAAGYAAALCSKRGITPADVDGKEVRAHMETLGHEL